MNDYLAYAVIPTRDRHDMLADCIDSLLVGQQVCRVVVVDNGSKSPVDVRRWHGLATVIRRPMDPPNISTLWNEGLNWAAADARRMSPDGMHSWPAWGWDVLVVNDDVICPPNLVATLSARMRERDAAMAYPDQAGGQQEILHTAAEPVDLRQRITGYAFLLRGETGLQADPSLAWWYGDDDLDWRARKRGGSLLVPGVPVEHRAPNVQTAARRELSAQAGRDRQTFITKWGKAPH